MNENYYFTRHEGVKLSKEIDEIRISLDSIVKANIKIEFFIRGGLTLYALEYFGGKDFLINMIGSFILNDGAIDTVAGLSGFGWFF